MLSMLSKNKSFETVNQYKQITLVPAMTHWHSVHVLQCRGNVLIIQKKTFRFLPWCFPDKAIVDSLSTIIPHFQSQLLPCVLDLY